MSKVTSEQVEQRDFDHESAEEAGEANRRLPWSRRGNEVAGVLLITLGCLLLLSVLSFQPSGANLIGSLGNLLAEALLFGIGIVSLGFAIVPVLLGVSLVRNRRLVVEGFEIAGLAIFAFVIPAVMAMTISRQVLGHDAGGLLGGVVAELLRMLLGGTGAAVVCAGLGIVGLILVTGFSPGDFVQEIASGITRWWRRPRKSRAHTSEIHIPSEDNAAHAGVIPLTGAAQELSASPVVADKAPETGRVSTTSVEAPASTRTGQQAIAQDDSSLFSRMTSMFRRQSGDEVIREEPAAPVRSATILENADSDPVWVQSIDPEDPIRSGIFGTIRDTPAPRAQRLVAPAAPAIPSASNARASVFDAPLRRDDEVSETGASTVVNLPAAPAAGEWNLGSDNGFGPKILESEVQKARKRPEELDRVRQGTLTLDNELPEWKLPPLTVLNYENSVSAVNREEITEMAMELERVLADFKFTGKVTNVLPGPVVTTFEFEPDRGIKVSRINNMSDDILMALKVKAVRIMAPIPGKGCVGIEVPNKKSDSVYLKEILADDVFVKAKSKLTLALGKDTKGYPVVMDLAGAPHLLVAGTTGSGKSVSVNAMITSILFNASPDEVKLILIDPKQLEFALYENAPHLLLPVVTDVDKAAVALNWAVQMMEQRYALIKDLGGRDIASYNARLKTLQEQRAKRLATDPGAPVSPAEARLSECGPDGKPIHQHMFRLVVIVDEWADLIMSVGKEVETAVARLTQKARAAGIHVILATQRPSVNVLTGLIKSNFPSRISFQLPTANDSRVILESNGAEALLGKGDMLYHAGGGGPLRRVHGAFVSEGEIEKVVEFLANQREPEFDDSILAAVESGGNTGGGVAGEYSDKENELYDRAVEFVLNEGKASTSSVQRYLSIGYNRAANIIDRMEQEGLIGPAKRGGSQRDVIGRGGDDD